MSAVRLGKSMNGSDMVIKEIKKELQSKVQTLIIS